MRRISLFWSVVAIVLLGLVALAAQPPAFAQEGTPAADEAMSEEGLTYEAISFASGVDLVSPGDMIVARIGMEPGAGFAIDDSDPTGGIGVVESGSVTIWLDVPWTIARAGTFANAIATAEATGVYEPEMEEIAADEEATLEAGDSAYIPPSINGEIRNDGDEPAMLLAFLVGPPDEMMAEGEGEATPAS